MFKTQCLSFLSIKHGYLKNSTCCRRVLERPKSYLVEFWPKLAIWGHSIRAKSSLWDLNPIVWEMFESYFFVFNLWYLNFLKILYVAQEYWSGPNHHWLKNSQNWPSEAMQLDPSPLIRPISTYMDKEWRYHSPLHFDFIRFTSKDFSSWSSALPFFWTPQTPILKGLRIFKTWT